MAPYSSAHDRLLNLENLQCVSIVQHLMAGRNLDSMPVSMVNQTARVSHLDAGAAAPESLQIPR